MMKQHYLMVFLSLLLPSCCLAQYSSPPMEEGKMAYIAVVTDSTKDAKQLFGAARLYFSSNQSNFQRGNSEKISSGGGVFLGMHNMKGLENVDGLYNNEDPVKLADKEAGIIVAKVVNKYTGGKLGCIRTVFVEYDFKVSFKDGKYRYEIANFNYVHYNSVTGKQMQFYGMKDTGACKSKGTAEELMECTRCKAEFQKFWTYLDADTRQLISDFKTVIAKGAESDW